MNVTIPHGYRSSVSWLATWSHPGRLKAVDASLAQRVKLLLSGVEVDLDAPLSADVG